MMRFMMWVGVSLFALDVLAAAPLHKVPNASPERYIVIMDDDKPAPEYADALAREVRGRLVHVYSTVLNGFSIKANEQAAMALTKRPGVKAVWDVGAMHANGNADVVTGYSNQGPCVDIYAPSEVEWGDPDTVAGGTSAAAPHVAGVFAIRWAASTTSSSGEIEGLVKGLATTGVLTNIWGTSNNLLLYSLRPKRRSVGS